MSFQDGYKIEMNLWEWTILITSLVIQHMGWLSATSPNQDQYSTIGSRIFLHSAFFDNRYDVTKWYIVHVFALQVGQMNHTAMCQFYRDYQLVNSTASMHVIDNDIPSDSPFRTLQYTCEVPNEAETGQVILLVPGFTVLGNQLFVQTVGVFIEHQQTLAVCGVFPPKYSFRDEPSIAHITEWMEIHRIVGVQYFAIYNFYLPSNFWKVMKYYEKHRLANIIEFEVDWIIKTLKSYGYLTAEKQVHLNKQLYILASNDCFYRYRLPYKYILFSDVNDLTLPTKFKNLQQMLKTAVLKHHHAAAFSLTYRSYTIVPSQAKQRSCQISNSSAPQKPNTAQVMFINTFRALSVYSLRMLEKFRTSKSYLLDSKNYGYVSKLVSCKALFNHSQCTTPSFRCAHDDLLDNFKNRIQKNVKYICKRLKRRC